MQLNKIVPVVTACAAVAQGASVHNSQKISGGQLELAPRDVSQSTHEINSYARDSLKSIVPVPTSYSASTVVASPCASGTIPGNCCPTITPRAASSGTQYSNGSDCKEGDDDCECEEIEEIETETGTAEYKNEPATTKGTTTSPKKSPETTKNRATSVPTPATVPAVLAASAAAIQKASFAALAVFCGIFFIFL